MKINNHNTTKEVQQTKVALVDQCSDRHKAAQLPELLCVLNKEKCSDDMAQLSTEGDGECVSYPCLRVCGGCWKG